MLGKLKDLGHSLTLFPSPLPPRPPPNTQVLELDPANAWAAATAARLNPVVPERHEKLKAEMLGKLMDLGNSLLGKLGLSLDNFKAEQDPAGHGEAPRRGGPVGSGLSGGL